MDLPVVPRHSRMTRKSRDEQDTSLNTAGKPSSPSLSGKSDHNKYINLHHNLSVFANPVTLFNDHIM